MDDPRPVTNHELQFQFLLNQRLELEGDIAEFGCYNGGSTAILAKMVVDNAPACGWTRKVWAFDTFEGLPKEDFDKRLDGINPPGKFEPSRSIEELCKKYPRIFPVKGRYIDTLPKMDKDLKIVLAYVDCDYYQSHMQVYEWLPSHLVKGAALVIDDYGACPGAKQATDEFMAKHGLVWYEPKGDKWLRQLIVWTK